MVQVCMAAVLIRQTVGVVRGLSTSSARGLLKTVGQRALPPAAPRMRQTLHASERDIIDTGIDTNRTHVCIVECIDARRVPGKAPLFTNQMTAQIDLIQPFAPLSPSACRSLEGLYTSTFACCIDGFSITAVILISLTYSGYNCAGGVGGNPSRGEEGWEAVEDVTLAKFQKLFDINVVGVLHTSGAVAVGMKKARGE
jgi:NAD(P)-dependent dehydrogenase (short-subunit alcohol dehydrogenase family)